MVCELFTSPDLAEQLADRSEQPLIWSDSMLAKLSIVVAAVAAMTTGYVFNSTSSCASKCAAVTPGCCACCDAGCFCCETGSCSCADCKCTCEGCGVAGCCAMAAPKAVSATKATCCPSSAAKVVSAKAACCDCCEAGCACCVGGACGCAICGCDGNCCVAATPVVAKAKKCCEGGDCSDKK